MRLLYWFGLAVLGSVLGVACGVGLGLVYVLKILPPHPGNMGDGGVPIVLGGCGAVVGPVLAVIAGLAILARRTPRPS